MRKIELDEVDIRIIEELNRQIVPNVSKIAQKLRVSRETIRYRLNKLVREGKLTFYPKVNHVKIGLVRLQIFSVVSPKFEDDYKRGIKIIPYLVYNGKFYYKSSYGFLTSYFIPYGWSEIQMVTRLFEKLRESGIVKEYRIVECGEPVRFGYNFYVEDLNLSDVERVERISKMLSEEIKSKFETDYKSMGSFRVDEVDMLSLIHI